MKFFYTVALSVIFSCLLFQSSAADPGDKPMKELRLAITKMLKKPQLKTSANEMVRITFFMTPDHKIVVLKTDARTQKIDQFIKTRLNYKQVKVQKMDNNRILHIKVSFESR